jgi:hypothetical protein
MRLKREHATENQQIYMITTSTWGRRAFFRKERWAALLIDTLYHYRGCAYLLHEFVVVRKHLCQRPQEYPYSSARSEFECDPVPQGLKPQAMGAAVGAPEGAPFQNNGELTPRSKGPEATKAAFDNRNKIA